MTAAVETALPSHARPVPGSVNIPVAKFPDTPVKPAADLDVAKVASDILASVNQALEKSDYGALSRLFVEEGYWRDHLAVSWEFRTVQGPQGVIDFLQASAGSKDGLRLKKLALDATTPFRAGGVAPLDAEGKVFGLRFSFTLETSLGNGAGFLQAVEQSGEWKLFTFYTRLDELRGHEELTEGRRPQGVAHGGKPGRKNWEERREAEEGFNAGNDPAVLVVGAGQAGLTAAARLKMLGVETLVVDQFDRVGDNWRKRYHQLVLHDPVWYDHLPYLKFPSGWPIFTPKDKLAQWFEAYATLLELNVWTKTSLVYTRWEESKKHWTVIVNRTRADGTSEIRTFHPRHLIQATGHSGKKNMPEMKGIENFDGDVLCHSSEFPGAREGVAGKKKAVVVGSCNSAHDIAQDFHEKGYDITIVQRSTTHVVSSKSITEIANRGTYQQEPAGLPLEDCDTLSNGIPSAVLKKLHQTVLIEEFEADKATLDGLAKAGFKVDKGPDDAGLILKYYQRGGGYYIDVGASQLIVDGKIKVKQGQEIDEVLPRGLRFADGSELEADEIVFATGYQNMRTQTRVMFGDEVADKVNDVWGLNKEGEMRTIWQRSGHPGFWFHGGNLALCRYYSKLLALQIKGQEAGLYNDGEI